MATKTYGGNEIQIDNEVLKNPFVYDSTLQQVVDTGNAFILASAVADNPAINALYIEVDDGQKFMVRLDTVDERNHWLAVDSPHGLQYFARRRGQVVRNGVPVRDEFLSGVAVSHDFKQLILLDGNGRRVKRTAPKAMNIKEARVDGLREDK